jgi:hypothetical protein
MIKKFKQFIKEEASTELPTGPGGSFGPAFGETRVQNKTINYHNTNIIFSEIDNKFYTIDEFNDLYNEYLKIGGKENLSEFNKENLDKILSNLM